MLFDPSLAVALSETPEMPKMMRHRSGYEGFRTRRTAMAQSVTSQARHSGLLREEQLGWVSHKLHKAKLQEF